MSAVARAALRLAARLAACLVAVLCLWFFGPSLWKLLSPFIVATLIAAALQRPIHWGEKRLRLRHRASVGMWVVFLCALLFGLTVWLLYTAISQLLLVSGEYQTIITDITGLLRNASDSLLAALDSLPDTAEEWIRTALDDALSLFSESATSWLGQIVNFAINIASKVPNWFIYMNFLLVGVYLIAADYQRLRERLLGLMNESARSRSQLLSGTASQGIGGYVRVQLLYAALVLLASWPVLGLLGIPYAFLIALFAALLEFLPIVGNGTLYVPWAAVCFIISLPRLGIALVLLFLALSMVRRFSEPRLLSNHIGLSTLSSLVSMFVGMRLYGVMGLILAPIVLVVLKAAWQGRLLESTLRDIRAVVSYLRGELREPGQEVAEHPGGESRTRETGA